MSRVRGRVTVLAVLMAVLMAGVGCTPQEAARNGRLLGLEPLSFEATGADQTRVTWRIPGFDPGVSQVDVPGNGVTPSWLTEPIEVRRGPGVLVFGAVGSDLDRFLKDAKSARSRVLAFFLEWDGKLVVEVPSTNAVLADALNGEPEDYEGVAAITSASDGSRRPDSPIHVFVNSGVYADMAPTAARIVMTHEVVHVATRAPTVRVPLWWAEGLADYVAFAEVDRRDAGDARTLLRRGQQQMADYVLAHGVPDGLPDEADFAGNDQDAAYASARLACEILADASGSASRTDIGRFQRLLANAMSVRRAIRQVFGISYADLVEAWQRRLAGIADQTG